MWILARGMDNCLEKINRWRFVIWTGHKLLYW